MSFEQSSLRNKQSDLNCLSNKSLHTAVFVPNMPNDL